MRHVLLQNWVSEVNLVRDSQCEVSRAHLRLKHKDFGRVVPETCPAMIKSCLRQNI